MRVLAVVLNYNSSGDAIRLYTDLERQNIVGLDFLVIDNCSLAEERSKLEAHIPKHQLLLNEKNTGYAGGNNLGIAHAIKEGYDFVWILNPDIRVKEGVLDILLDTISRSKKIAAVGPRILFRDNPEVIYSDGGMLYPEKSFKAVHLNTCKRIDECPANIREVSYANGSCLLARTAVFKEEGLFCEDFFLYFEESEWCYRIAGKGYISLVNPAASVYHESSKKGIRYYFYMTRNRIWMCRLYQKGTKQAVTDTIAIIRKIIRELLTGKFKNRKILRGFVSGLILGLYGKIEARSNKITLV